MTLTECGKTEMSADVIALFMDRYRIFCGISVEVLLELFQIHFRILAGLLTERSGGSSPEALEFEMKDLGSAKKILGMEISKDRKSGLLFLSEQNYIKKVLQRFNMQNSKAVSTPIAPHFNLSAAQCPRYRD